MDDLYRRYDHRFVDPDPLEFVRRQTSAADREVVGLIASSLAYGNVGQIKRSIGRVLEVIGDGAAAAVDRLEPRAMARRLSKFKHRFNDGRDVACLLFFIRQMREQHGSIEEFFRAGHDARAADVGPALISFTARTLALDHGGLYGRGALPAAAGVRFFFPSPASGSACKRLNLFLRWMVRHDEVDLGVWTRLSPARLIVPLDTHVIRVGRCLRLTRYTSPGWPMAHEITSSLRRLDPDDPVKYDFALCHLGMMNACGFNRAQKDSQCPLRGVCHPKVKGQRSKVKGPRGNAS